MKEYMLKKLAEDRHHEDTRPQRASTEKVADR